MAPASRFDRIAARLTPLRWTFAFLALFVLATAGIVAVMVWRTNALLSEQVLQVIVAESRGLDEQYHIGGLPLLVQTISDRSRLAGNGLYLLIDGGGARLAGNLESFPNALRDAPGGGLFRYAVRTADGGLRERLAIGFPIRIGGASAQTSAQLLIARDIEDISAFARATRVTLLAGIGLTSLLALAGAMIYSRTVRRRVDAVTAASQRIMAGDLAQRLPVAGTDDEIDRLSGSLNVMLSRIEQLLTGLREVSDNIAHDLKTPLTRLRNRAEAALRDPRGEAAYREGLERTLEEADELIKTFNALLSIARLEAGAGSAHSEEVDLISIVRDTVELYEPVAEEAGLRIVFEPVLETGGEPQASARPAIVRADRQLIGQTVVNLIENAMKYGCDRPDTRVDARLHGEPDIAVSVTPRDGWVDIVVADHGPGIPAEDRERALRRFVRLEASRTRPGTGLGLSLVAAVTRLHKGKLRLEDNAPGLRVVLSLPTTGRTR